MNKVYNSQFEETYVEDQCENGLKIVVWHKPDFLTTSCLFATPYGSLDVNQIDDHGNKFTYPAGIAHFLEHKLFESGQSDVMTQFSELGANVNAFTSYRETVYYFNTSNEDIDKPLNLLLDFVQDLQISTESVEKEKGIINQELAMYLEMPDTRLFFETMKSLYHHHPINLDIGGSFDTVNETTKEILELCYKINYHPSRMHIIVVTPQDPKKVIDLIKKNQASKNFKPFIPIHRFLKEEPEIVAQEEKKIIMEVNQPKTCIAFKLPVIKNSDYIKKEWCLRFALESYFSSMNPSYQSWLNDKKISHFFGYDLDFAKDSAFLIFYDEGIQPDQFKSFILEEQLNLKKTNLNKNQLLQLKNRAFGETLSIFNNPNDIAIRFFRSFHQGISLFDLLNIIQSISVADCQQSIEELDFSHLSRVIIDSN